jgi:hypothetical protein
MKISRIMSPDYLSNEAAVASVSSSLLTSSSRQAGFRRAVEDPDERLFRGAATSRLPKAGPQRAGRLSRSFAHLRRRICGKGCLRNVEGVNAPGP